MPPNNPQPHLLLLQALERELAGGSSQKRTPWEEWAREVMRQFRRFSPDQAIEPERVLAVANHALRSIMCSESWQFLLDDSLRRPEIFARSLLIMLHGSSAFSQARPETGSILH